MFSSFSMRVSSGVACQSQDFTAVSCSACQFFSQFFLFFFKFPPFMFYSTLLCVDRPLQPFRGKLERKKKKIRFCVLHAVFFFLLLTPTPPPLNLPSWVESGCSWSRTHPQWTPPPLSYRKNVVSPIVSYWVHFGFLHGPLNFGFDNFISYQIVELPDESWNSVETRRRPSPLFLRALVWKLKIIKNNKKKKKSLVFSIRKPTQTRDCYRLLLNCSGALPPRSPYRKSVFSPPTLTSHTPRFPF